MVDRINLILKAKNITPRQFADEIGIQPSGMSHILSGRNNPSLDFVMKVVRRYPEIDIKWLMFGQGEMYTSVLPLGANVAPSSEQSPSPAPASVPPSTSPTPVPSPATAAASTASPSQQSVGNASSSKQVDDGPDLFSFVDAPQPASAPQAVPDPQPTINPQAASASQSAPASQPVDARQSTTTSNLSSAETVVSTAPVAGVVADQQPVPQAQNEQLKENGVNVNGKGTDPEYRNLTKESDKSLRKRIVKVVILYDDHSFSEYYPE